MKAWGDWRTGVSLVLLVILGGLGLWSRADRRVRTQSPPREPARIADRLPSDTPLGPIPRNAAAVNDTDESRVRVASAAIPLGIALAAPGAGEDSITITEVQQEDYVWSVEKARTILLLYADEPVIIRGTGPAPTQFTSIPPGGPPVESSVTPEGSSRWSATATLAEQTTTQTVTFKNGQNDLGIISLRLPGSQPPIQPSITRASNNMYAAPTSPNSPSTNITDEYFHLQGHGAPQPGGLDFHVFQTSDGEKNTFLGQAVLARPLKVESNGVWDAELLLPLFPQVGQNYEVVAVAKTSGDTGHVVGNAKVTLVGTDRAKPNAISGFKVNSKDNTSHKPLRVNTSNLQFSGEAPADGSVSVLIFSGDDEKPTAIAKPTGGGWTANYTVGHDGKYSFTAAVVQGKTVGERTGPITVHVGTTPPSVQQVDPINLATSPKPTTIRVCFNPNVKLDATGLTDKFTMKSKDERPSVVEITLGEPNFNQQDNVVTFTISQPIAPGVYDFTVKKDIQDIFGNNMVADYHVTLFMPVGGEAPTVSRGITGPRAPKIEFPEYTKPREFPNGFNPSDHVETRVSRLYYYRDAHRIAQIINRDAQSYNRGAVEMQQQLADKARQIADQATAERQEKERRAIETAQQSRAAERELQAAQAQAAQAADHVLHAEAERKRIAEGSATPSDADKKKLTALERDLPRLEALAEQTRNAARAASERVQALRPIEAAATEAWHKASAAEDRARDEQFRREVAAAHADPDTFAPGNPDSEDPVNRVSVSVIGEGLIQLRGPIKGINTIRTMINQLDAPVGQVRVAVHTVQINGEKGDRMENVAGRIQRFVDHSRFLTLQSAEMLRKAIVTVAAQRASELGGIPGLTQEERDRKYLHAFFGEDFIRELEAMDSEFLKTGNKLLSLHSMDSTSLASALFIMALAKNTIRAEILHAFDGMMAGELPMAEQNYFEAGLTCDGKHKLFDKYCKRDEFQLLSGNARFQSLRGMFDAEIAADDTMTPVQREFVRLAQIFKSRLIVEMELKQRVMERAVIEQRQGNYLKELKDAQKLEDEAKEELRNAAKSMVETRRKAVEPAIVLTAHVDGATKNAGEAVEMAESSRKRIMDMIDPAELAGGVMIEGDSYEAAKANFGPLSRRLNEEQGPAAVKNLNELLGKDLADLYDYREILKPLGDENDLGNRLLAYDKNVWDFHDKIQQLYIGKPASARPDMNLRFDLPWDHDIGISVSKEGTLTLDSKEDHEFLRKKLDELISQAEQIQTFLDDYKLEGHRAADKEKADKILERVLKTKPAEASDDELLNNLHRMMSVFEYYSHVAKHVRDGLQKAGARVDRTLGALADATNATEACQIRWTEILADWREAEKEIDGLVLRTAAADLFQGLSTTREALGSLLASDLLYQEKRRAADAARRPLDHKKFLDMLVDEMEDKYIELLEGTRAHTANIDAYIKRLMTCLDDDFNTQFYYPTFRKVREASQFWDVQMGQVETTNVLANNRAFAKVSPQATMEFDLPKRDIMIAEAINGAKAMIDDVGALAQDPTFLAMAKLNGGQPTSSPIAGASGGLATMRNVLPGLSTSTAETVLGQQGPGGAQFGAALEGLIPDPAIYKFETGTGWEIRPVIQPDGQAVVFHFNYMYTTNIREPVRADEKHLGRVKRHFVDTDVQLSNYELREVSRYTVALKAARTARGVPLLEDIPVAGVLFRPLPSAESSLQQNVILSQATIFPTLFDLMGLRWAPVVADLDPLGLSNDEFIVRNRRRVLMNRVFDHSSSQVDEFLRIPPGERRMDLYRSQQTVPSIHPNGYSGPGANLHDSQLQEGYAPTDRGETQFVPGHSREGSPLRPQRPSWQLPGAPSLDAPDSAPGHEGECPTDMGQPYLGAPQTMNRPSPQFLRPAAAYDPGASPALGARDVGIQPAAPISVNRTSYTQVDAASAQPPAAFGPAAGQDLRARTAAGLKRLPQLDDKVRGN